MITHYLKVAVRNLLKYRTQSLISIVGLSIGLVTFSLSSIWLKYEMNYDTHWPDADRIYQIGDWNELDMEKFSRYTSFLASSQLKEAYPEIEASCAFQHQQTKENGKDIRILKTDSTYTHLFPLTILKGNNQFLYDHRLAGITESAAIRLFGTTDVLEKKLGSNWGYGTEDGLIICALLKDDEGHSNYPYDLIVSSSNQKHSWGYRNAITLVRLVRGTDVEALNEKLKQHKRIEPITLFDGSQATAVTPSPYMATPLGSLHYTYPLTADAIRLEHIRLFNVIGLVVVLCALLNYLILYIIRLRIRRREMALRRVHGASESNLLRMTMTEFLLLTAVAVLLGTLIAECLFRPFKDLTGIEENVGFLYRETAIYMGAVVLVSLVLSAVTLYIQQRHSLRASLQPVNSSGRFFTFQRLAMCMQLFISIFVSFATFTLQKQLHHLHHSSDMGFTNMDIVIAEGWISFTEKDVDTAMEQLPFIEYYKTKHIPFPAISYKLADYNVMHEDDKGEVHTIPSKAYHISIDAFQVFGMQIVAGELPTEANSIDGTWINESFAAQIGWEPSEAIGKKLYSLFFKGYMNPDSKDFYTIRGVVKDLQISPVLPCQPSVYHISSEINVTYGGKNDYRMRFFTTSITDMKMLSDSIYAHLERCFPEEKDGYMKARKFYTVRQLIENALQSERVLLKLLNIASGVCLLITLFGIFSIVNLSCERRRKEIALRKVHGAKTKDIIALFIKEYGILLILSATLAFAVGYAVMKSWLQNYVIQTSISWWIYASILLTVFLLIMLCVGHRVWKAANENPADVVKSE